MQIGVSIKALLKNPFDNIENYKVGENYDVVVKKVLAYGVFCELEDSLVALLHQSQISWTEKNPFPKNYFKVGQKIKAQIISIDKDNQRISISHKLTQENPFETFEKKYPVGTVIDAQVVNKNEYSLFVSVKDLDLDAFLHCNDLTYLNNGEEELEKYNKGDKIKVKRELESGWFQWVTLPFPSSISIQSGINEPRYPSLKGIMGAKRKELNTLESSPESQSQSFVNCLLYTSPSPRD